MRAKHVKARGRRSSQKPSIVDRVGPLGWPVIALLVLAFAIGGGGSRYGVQNLVVQLAALGMLVWFLAEALATIRSRPLALQILVALTLALPLLQLLPLPPAAWQALPTSQLSLPTRELVGAQGGWFPISLDPQRTLIAFASLVPALAILCLMPGRIGAAQMALRVIVAIALANFAVGVLQVLGGENLLLPYPIIEKGRLYGLFASHNTSGLFFVTALCALLGVRSSGNGSVLRDRIILGSIAALLVLGTILTQSRSSTALLLVPAAVFVARSYAEQRAAGRRIRWEIVGLVVILLGGFVAFALTNERMLDTFVRFEELDNKRPDVWQDSLVALAAFFPFGSGMGSFDEIFQNFESLEHVTRTYARRAHNDYIELGIEAGLFGFALLAGWAVWIAKSWFGARKAEEHREVDAAALAMLVIAAQSILDYPLRNQAVLCLAAVFIAVLAGHRTRILDGVREKT